MLSTVMFARSPCAKGLLLKRRGRRRGFVSSLCSASHNLTSVTQATYFLLSLILICGQHQQTSDAHSTRVWTPLPVKIELLSISYRVVRLLLGDCCPRRVSSQRARRIVMQCWCMVNLCCLFDHEFSEGFRSWGFDTERRQQNNARTVNDCPPRLIRQDKNGPAWPQHGRDSSPTQLEWSERDLAVN